MEYLSANIPGRERGVGAGRANERILDDSGTTNNPDKDNGGSSTAHYSNLRRT